MYNVFFIQKKGEKKMTKQQEKKIKLAFGVAIKEALNEHKKHWSIKTLDFANANKETTDFYVALEGKR